MTDRSLVHIAFYAALMAALGFMPPVVMPLAGGVPITAQTLGVMLAGVMLGPVRGALAILLFLFLVALGAPFLAGGRGGLGVFQTPSVGFLIGWPVGAFVAGWVMRLTGGMAILPASALAAFVGGILAVYAFGIPGISIMAGLPLVKAAYASVVYIPGDLIKVAITALIAQTVARGLPGALLSRS
ncbi:BioY family transporter [Rhodobacterales bacterium]|nr:BioY family transporter [Rhodobacterales bacterium]